LTGLKSIMEDDYGQIRVEHLYVGVKFS